MFEVFFLKGTEKKIRVVKNVLFAHYSAYKNNVLLACFSRILLLIHISLIKPPMIADGVLTTRLSIINLAA